jgi:prepilin-type N-terminal cleavage/methylation domain-containing protein
MNTVKSSIQNITQSIKKSKGFTLVEILCVVVLLGILGGIGVSLMRDTATTGRANALAKNANEINNLVNNLRSAGSNLNQAAYAVAQGTATTAATVALPAAAVAADVTTFLTLLSGAGIQSYGNTAALGRAITTTSYTYTWVNGAPVFTGIAGSNP